MVQAGRQPLVPTPGFRARALLLGARLELRSWPEAEVLARMPLAVRVPAGGVAVLFRHGIAVLFGLTADAEKALRERLTPLLEHRYRTPEAEELEVRIEPEHPEGLRDGGVAIHSPSFERLQLIAESLSKSLLLSHYETRIAADFDRIEPLALQLERRGRIQGSTREHLRRIGALLLIESRTVGRAEIGEKPELLWEHPELERLHALLESEFELRERFAALERKFSLVGRTSRTLVDLLNAKHALRVEWYIVALIALDILLVLYGFWRG
jgi:uncharacterized Rmd1/YagE family protein